MRIAGPSPQSADRLEADLIREIARHTPTLLFIADPAGRVTFVNDRWVSVIGALQAELLGNAWIAFVHPDDRERVKALWPAHARRGEPYKAQWRLRRMDGTYRWIEIRAEAEFASGGRVARWYGVGIDIDEQRRALDALEFLVESGASIAGEQDVMKILERLALASLAGVADISIFDLLGEDGGTRLVVASPDVPEESVAAVRAFGPPKIGSGHPIAQAIARLESVVIASVDDAYLRSHVEDEARRESWRTAGFHSFLAVPMLVGSRAIGALTLLRTLSANAFQASDVRILEDVARRAAVAVENIRLNDAARRESLDSSDQFHRIADLSPQFMWTADANGKIAWWNKRWYAFSGQTQEESLGFGSEALLHPDDVQMVTEKWMHALATAEPFECEYRLRGIDGHYRWFFGRAIADRDVSGAVDKWYGSTADIHESRRASRTIGLFADLGEALSETLGLEETLKAILDIVVPAYADWGYISLADSNAELRVAAIVHHEAEKQAILETVTGKPLAERDARIGSPEVFRTRTPMLVRRTDYAEAQGYLRGDVFAIFQSVGFASVLICPLLVGTDARGTLVLCMSDPQRLFDPEDVPFFQELARRVAPAIANAELYERERRVAKSFQQAALPAALPACPGFEFDAVYEAGLAEALVGGDWYDAFVLIDGRIVVSIGDVAGSGLEAAVIMASVRQAIRGVAQVHADPDLMLEAADRALRGENPDRFVTAFVGVIDPVEGTLAYQSAGHSPPLLCLAGGGTIELSTGGLPLGLRTDDEPATKFTRLYEGALLVLYTDGLVESTHDFVEGERRLRDAISDAHFMDSRNPAKRLHDAILTEGSRDDVAILTVRICSLQERRRWMVDVGNVDAAREARRAIVAALAARGLSAGAISAAELVLAELIANIARYAPGDAEFLLEWNGSVPVLHALDRGLGFEFAAKLPSDVYSESGRGLFLVAKLTRDFNVMRRPSGGSHARAVLKT
ncbi:MAG: SpoIIE family protein phosphatase [Candidatus Eremiobacteraeota bacterium]|nr:SpoIIE family protein phosphatase [Candidatus Eremiobacteraeota bacterium]